jgi:hypothetical protein
MKKLIVTVMLLCAASVFSQGEDWLIYTTSNSDLPFYLISALASDNQGNIWIGTGDPFGNGRGLAKFNGENWTVYNTSNSILPHNDVYDIKIDDQDNVWIGCGDHIPSSVGGLLKFDGTDWTLYNKTNSPIPYNLVYTLTIDPDGNIWTGSVNFDEPGGLVCFHPGTVSFIDMNTSGNVTPSTFSLFQNYPNPFNPETTIRYDLAKSGHVKISIYNISGQQVKMLKQGFQTAGSYKIQWNGRNSLGEAVPSGIYLLELTINGYRQTKRMILLK